MNSSYVFDSWALIALIQAEEPAAARVKDLLEKAITGDVTLYFSLLNLGELFYIIGRRRGKVETNQIIEKIKSLPINILSVDERFVFTAAEFKMNFSIPYADAFCAAAAKHVDGTLLTGDSELFALIKEIKIEPLFREK